MNESTDAVVQKPTKRNIGVKRAAGALFCTIIFAYGTFVNLDVLAKIWYREGSLLAATACLAFYTSIENVLGVKNNRVANAWTDLARCYSKVPRYKDAARALKLAIEMKQKLVGAGSAPVLCLQAQLAEYLAQDKRFAECDLVLSKTLKQAQSLSPPNQACRGYVLESMTRCLITQRRFDDAIDAARQLEQIDNELLVRSKYSFNAREVLAEIYALKQQPEIARALAEESLTLKSKYVPADNVQLALAHETLGKVLVAVGEKEKARAEFKQAITLLEKDYGSASEKIQYWKARYEHLLQQQSPFESTD